MPENFESMLTGGHHKSLGRTDEVAQIVLVEPQRLQELYDCYQSNDEVVRLRTSSALKRVQAAKSELLIPFYDRLISEIGNLDQASAQWTLAILFAVGKPDLTATQLQNATEIMQRNLAHNNDWIVLNTTMGTLTDWSLDDQLLREWLIPHLKRLHEDRRKSVKARAQKMLKRLNSAP